VSGGAAGSPNVVRGNVAGAPSFLGNKGNGIALDGTGNGPSSPVEIDGNTAQANAHDGFKITGTANKLRNNVGGGAASSSNNKGCQFDVAAGNLNFTGNTSSGAGIPGASGSPFPTGCQ